jgi:hypothetical protein
MASILSSVAFLDGVRRYRAMLWASHETYMSKTSFQYGFSVFLMTEVVRVCSPPIVATAKGSGNPSFDQLLVSFCL